MALRFEHRPALVAYVTCGDPDLTTTKEVVVAAIGAGADVIELGVPFSDPVADGPVIQRASQRALDKGTRMADVLDLARDVRKQSDAGLIVYSYLNPVLRFGLERFADAAQSAGIDGALITDLTVDEASDYLRVMSAHKLATVFVAAPTSTDARLKRVASASTGFVYAVSRTGITGQQKQLSGDAYQLVQRLRKFTRLPIAVGFGISNADQFAEAGSFADACAVGSAIVQTIEQSGSTSAASAVAKLIYGLRDKQSANSNQHTANTRGD